MRIFLLGITLLLLSACSQKSDDLNAIEEQCLNSMEKNDDFCGCLVDLAEDDLTEKQIAFVAAGFEKNKSRIKELNGELGFEGALKAGVFMAKSVKKCSSKNN